MSRLRPTFAVYLRLVSAAGVALLLAMLVAATGSFGPLDSGRKDVAYEDFRGHKLDRAMIELLRAH